MAPPVPRFLRLCPPVSVPDHSSPLSELDGPLAANGLIGVATPEKVGESSISSGMIQDNGWYFEMPFRRDKRLLSGGGGGEEAISASSMHADRITGNIASFTSTIAPSPNRFLNVLTRSL